MPKRRRNKEVVKSHPAIQKFSRTKREAIVVTSHSENDDAMLGVEDFDLFASDMPLPSITTLPETQIESMDLCSQQDEQSLLKEYETGSELGHFDFSELDVSSLATFDPEPTIFDEKSSKETLITPTHASITSERSTISPSLKAEEKPIAKIEPPTERLTLKISTAQSNAAKTKNMTFFKDPSQKKLKDASNEEIIEAIRTLASRNEIAKKFGVTYSGEVVLKNKTTC